MLIVFKQLFLNSKSQLVLTEILDCFSNLLAENLENGKLVVQDMFLDCVVTIIDNWFKQSIDQQLFSLEIDYRFATPDSTSIITSSVDSKEQHPSSPHSLIGPSYPPAFLQSIDSYVHELQQQREMTIPSMDALFDLPSSCAYLTNVISQLFLEEKLHVIATIETPTNNIKTSTHLYIMPEHSSEHCTISSSSVQSTPTSSPPVFPSSSSVPDSHTDDPFRIFLASSEKIVEHLLLLFSVSGDSRYSIIPAQILQDTLTIAGTLSYLDPDWPLSDVCRYHSFS